jgi:transposase
MCPLRYYHILRQSKDPLWLRFELVRYAREYGIKPAVREFSITIKTVRKWLRRPQPSSLRGLEDRSRALLHSRHSITAGQRQRAVSLKRHLPSWRAARLKRDYGLPLSEKALLRIWREEELAKRKRRKHKTKRRLREVKKLWRLFDQTCIDTQDLCDITELWAHARVLGLPRYSTWRERSSPADTTSHSRRNARSLMPPSSPRSSSHTWRAAA